MVLLLLIKEKSCPMKKSKSHLILIMAIVLIVSGQNAFAQRQKVPNLPKYDQDFFHPGFNLGINVANFKITYAADLNHFDSLYVIDNLKQTGFNLGIVTDFRLSNHFNLRFIPTMIFAQRNLNYTFYINNVKSSVTTKQIESTFINLPLSLKLKSNRLGNARCYAIVGAQYMIDMVSQAKVENKDKQFVKLYRKDYGYHVGMGFDFYMEMFKLSTEISMYNGVNNLLVPDNTVYAKALTGLRSKVFFLSFYFE